MGIFQGLIPFNVRQLNLLRTIILNFKDHFIRFDLFQVTTYKMWQGEICITLVLYSIDFSNY